MSIVYPYLPDGKKILYVPATNAFMRIASEFARLNSLDMVMPGAAVVVKDGVVLGIGANGSDYHKNRSCQRVMLACRSGEGYELCEGCHPKNHSEAKAIRFAHEKNQNTIGADLYLWGHWWFCEPCWNVIIEAGIRNCYVLEGSERLFNKEHPNNIVGKQFMRV